MTTLCMVILAAIYLNKVQTFHNFKSLLADISKLEGCDVIKRVAL